MIVNVGGILFIINALLGLVMLSQHGVMYVPGSRVGLVITSAYFGALGIGLLMRVNWARWLSLGTTLLTWTLGSLGVGLWAAGALQAIFLADRNVFSMLVFVVVVGALFSVLIVINYKLFHHLISEDGRDQFKTPEAESKAVLKSSGVYLAQLLVLVFLNRSFYRDSIDLGSLQSADRARVQQQEEHAREAEVARINAERTAREREGEQFQRDTERDARNEQARRELESTQSPPQVAGNAKSAPVVTEQRMPAARASERPVQESRPYAVRMKESSNTEKPTTNQILKCRDASGAVTFTQGFCPAGTQRVDTPKTE